VRALVLADRLARQLDARVRAVSVCDSELGRDQMIEYYEKLVARTGRTGLEWQLPIENDDPGARIVEAADEWSNPLVCMSSHGRGRLATAVLGSVARSVLASSRRPVVVCGPAWESSDEGHHARPIAACVDGSDASDTVLRTAAAWARRVQTDVHVMTVAEPAPSTLSDDTRFRRAHGPDIDADLYVGELARAVERTGVRAVPHAVYDPVSVAAGVHTFLREHPVELLVVATNNRFGLAQLTVGSQAARIVHESAVPVVLVRVEQAA
jgi:nucleotide-binding universal stress UspA family protein